MARGPLLDLSSGYVQRRSPAFPQAHRGAWTAEHAYEQDVERLRRGPVGTPRCGSPAGGRSRRSPRGSERPRVVSGEWSY